MPYSCPLETGAEQGAVDTNEACNMQRYKQAARNAYRQRAVGSRQHATFDRNSYAIVNDMSAHRSDFFKRHEGVQVRQRIPRLSARLHA